MNELRRMPQVLFAIGISVLLATGFQSFRTGNFLFLAIGGIGVAGLVIYGFFIAALVQRFGENAAQWIIVTPLFVLIAAVLVLQYVSGWKPFFQFLGL